MRAPWNAAWSGEGRYEVRNCRWAGGRPAIWQPHQPGDGYPIFGEPHMVRQRRSVAEYRCTVCGEKTEPWDRLWFRLGQPMDGWALVTTEAPVHRACADIAMKVCPHLRAIGRGPVPWPHPDATLCAMVGGPAVENDFGLDLTGRVVIGHLKFAWKRLPRSMRADT